MDDAEEIDDLLLDSLVSQIESEVDIYIQTAERSELVNNIQPASPAPPASKYKKTWKCYKCGLNLASKEKLSKHMTSRNCKRRIDIDESPEPHENIGCHFKMCLDQYKSSKEKNHSDERIL